MSYVAAGVGVASLVAGIWKSSSARRREKRAERAIERAKTPTYNPNQSVLDYYNKALAAYSQNPYSNPYYNNATTQINRNLATGLNSLRGRNSIGNTNRLVALSNDAATRAAMGAENLRMQQLGQLGNATSAKAADDSYGFQINQMMPFQKKIQLLGMKAGAAAQGRQAGWQMINNGINTIGIAAGSDGGSIFGGGSGNSNASLGQVNVTQGHPAWLDTYQDPYLTQYPG